METILIRQNSSYSLVIDAGATTRGPPAMLGNH